MDRGHDYIPLHVFIPPITDEQRDAAMLTCAMYAADADELRQFLEQLGLIDAR